MLESWNLEEFEIPADNDNEALGPSNLLNEFQEWKTSPSTHKITEIPNAVGHMQIQEKNNVGDLTKMNGCT